eukprot:119236-Pelagomonas_calceolata.AAC.1
MSHISYVPWQYKDYCQKEDSERVVLGTNRLAFRRHISLRALKLRIAQIADWGSGLQSARSSFASNA